MKKLVAIILVISIMFTVGVAFAEEDSPVEDLANIEEQTEEITDNGEPDTGEVPEEAVNQESGDETIPETDEAYLDSMELAEIVKTKDADLITEAIVHFVIDNNENDKAKQLYDMALEDGISFSEINIATREEAI